MFIILQTGCIQLWFLFTSDLHISSAGKQRNNQNLTLFNNVNLALPSLHRGSLEIGCGDNFISLMFSFLID